ncbi:hypothetical protein BDZ91DRAFT_710714 [Kalaharituber pfeilii]|nr:hypothetical protein BDZ91DRAFT_710714 [Kalaharituber pfeilii]
MPSRVLLSTEAAVSTTTLPVATKRRQKASLVKPFIPDAPATDGTQGEETNNTNSAQKKRKVVREKVYTCTYPNCTKSFDRPCRLDDHLNTHTGQRPHVCTDCGKSFFRDSHLRAHKKAVHEKNFSYQCDILVQDPASLDGDTKRCGRTFATAQHLKRHMESHQQRFPHNCTEYPPCTAGFRKKTQLGRHIRTEHLGLKPFACKYMSEEDPSVNCSMSFETKGKLESHVNREHKGVAKYFCEECMATEDGNGEGKEVLEAHIDGITAGTILLWPGDEDGKDEVGNGDGDGEQVEEVLATTSAGVTIVGLDACTPITASSTTTAHPAPALTATTGGTLSSRRGFKTYALLQAHIRSAHPPICKTCGKRCKSNRDLRLHVSENHSAPLEERRRRFVCETCGQGFARRWGMVSHQRTVHNGERPFACAFGGCEKAFGHKATMELHYNTHFTGRSAGREKSRTMKAGAKAPKNKGLLLTKLTGVGYEDLPGREIPCVVGGCKYRFGRRYDLEVHLETAHHFGERQITEVFAGVQAHLGVEGGHHGQSGIYIHMSSEADGQGDQKEDWSETDEEGFEAAGGIVVGEWS